MNKANFISLIADKHNLTKTKAENIIDIFVSSVISALAEGEEISLIGFGKFSIEKAAAKKGRNPRTGVEIQIPAYNKPKFKAGKNLKDACNI